MEQHTPPRSVSQTSTRRLKPVRELTFRDRTVSLPPYDNMGVNSDRTYAGKSEEIQGFTGEENPKRYFHRLALDTLQVAVEAEIAEPERFAGLMDARRRAEGGKVLGAMVREECHDGTKVEVKPHGGRPCYEVLAIGPDGLNIKCVPSENAPGSMPAFIIRFGARWCLEKSYGQLVLWASQFVEHWGCSVQEMKLSEVHIRCDVDTAFVDRDLKRVRGTGMRNAKLNTHRVQGRLTGMHNLGGKKPFKFNIYDKRRQVQEKNLGMWKLAWNRYGIDGKTPIWRIEGRWSREALVKLGVDTVDDLTPHAIAALWTWFTRQYLHFVKDPKVRTDRTGPTRKWKKVQEVTEVAEPLPPPEKLPARPDRLRVQAIGCLASMLARSGLGHDREISNDILQGVVREALQKVETERVCRDPAYVPVSPP